MPANLPQQYLDAERRFRESRTQDEKIECLEEMIALLPKHKGTDKIRAQLRRRMAKLQDDFQKRTGGRKGHDPYQVRKEGAGQIALFGLPNSGKSALVSSLTNAQCETADYPYTTRMPAPGMMTFETVKIQLVDLPPLMDEASRIWMPRALRKADSLAFVLDAGEDPLVQMEMLLEGLREMGLVLEGETGTDEEDRPFREVKGFICLNRADMLTREAEEVLADLEGWRMPVAAVSVLSGEGMDSFRRAAFDSLRIIRIYTKAPRKKAEMNDPVTLPAGSTVESAARALHKDFARGLKFARIWGEGVYEGQMVKKDHVLNDSDVVEFHI